MEPEVVLVVVLEHERDARLTSHSQRLVEQLGQPAEAEKLLGEFVARATAPERFLVQAQFLGRQQRTAEALALCAKAWDTCPAQAVGGVCLGILRAGPATAEQKQQVEAWLTKAIEKNPKVLLLVTLKAELLDFCERHDEAIAVHRQILDMDRNNVVAMNNLAHLLSLKDGKNGEALELIRKAIDLAGPLPEMLDTRAGIQLRLGRPELAVADLHQAIGQAATAPYFIHLAQAQLKTQNRQAAAESYKKAISLGFRSDQLHSWDREEYRKLVRVME